MGRGNLGSSESTEGGSLKGKDNGYFFSDFDGSGVSFGTLSAEITHETVDFFVSDAEGDPDRPSEGFSSIDQAINALRQGQVCFKFFLSTCILGSKKGCSSIC